MFKTVYKHIPGKVSRAGKAFKASKIYKSSKKSKINKTTKVNILKMEKVLKNDKMLKTDEVFHKYEEYFEKLKKIPLLNDLITLHQLSDIEININKILKKIRNEYINEKVINMYLTINDDNKYTNQEIYNYIKFLDYSGLDIHEYSKIAKHITHSNYYYYLPLFENENIAYNLLFTIDKGIYCVIPNNIVKNWLIKNFNSIMNNNGKDGHEFRNIHQYIIYKGGYTYYYIDNVVYSTVINLDKKLIENDMIGLISKTGEYNLNHCDNDTIYKYGIKRMYNIK